MGSKKFLNNTWQDIYPEDDTSYSIEDDQYLSPDDRYWESNIEDVDGGDNFADYCKYFFNLLEEEEYFEN